MFPIEILQHIASFVDDIVTVISLRCSAKCFVSTPRVTDAELIELNAELDLEHNYQRLIHVSKAALLKGYTKLYYEFKNNEYYSVDAAIIGGVLLAVEPNKQTNRSVYLCAKYNRREIYNILNGSYIDFESTIHAIGRDWIKTNTIDTQYGFLKAIRYNNVQLVRKLSCNMAVTSEHIIASPSKEMTLLLLQRMSKKRSLTVQAQIKLGRVTLFQKSGSSWLRNLTYAIENRHHRAIYILSGYTSLTDIIENNASKIQTTHRRIYNAFSRCVLKQRDMNALKALVKHNLPLSCDVKGVVFTQELFDLYYKHCPLNFYNSTCLLLVMSSGLEAVKFFDKHNIKYNKATVATIASTLNDKKLIEYYNECVWNHFCV